MTADPHEHAATGSASPCWCCGTEKSHAELVHLGSHPEVGICVRCARWLHRRARLLEHAHRPTLAGQARSVVHRARNEVIRRGWHRHGPLGTVLRRIDRYLP